jgi:hypothetical protein
MAISGPLIWVTDECIQRTPEKQIFENDFNENQDKFYIKIIFPK